jgi:hypothetical protein
MVAPRLGLVSARKVGSAPDNKGMNSYTIATGYATALAAGEPVKLHTDGTLIRGTNGADAIGVLQTVKYVDSQGNVKYTTYWPASTTATEIECLVIDDPNATFTAKANAAVTSVVPGEIYAVTTTAPDAALRRSAILVDVSGGTVAAGAGMVKVIKVISADDRILEVVLVNHSLRDDG